jgi:hypothetical protein
VNKLQLKFCVIIGSEWKVFIFTYHLLTQKVITITILTLGIQTTNFMFFLDPKDNIRLFENRKFIWIFFPVTILFIRQLLFAKTTFSLLHHLFSLLLQRENIYHQNLNLPSQYFSLSRFYIYKKD